MKSPWPYFSMEELSCHCGCGQMKMDSDFMENLVEMREELGFPMKITSGYRCPEYNAQVSTTGGDGPHTTGRAVDIALTPWSAAQLLELGYSRGYIRGVGVHMPSKNDTVKFIHIDDLGLRLWSY